MDEKPIVVVNIFSVSYSGSTWLNLMLGSHSEAFAVGELKHVRKLGRPLCMLHAEHCPVWSRFDPASEQNAFRQIHRLTGKRYLITNNSGGYAPEQQEDGIDWKSILLIRDGRAVTASYMRKYQGTSIWKASRWWAHQIRHVRRRFKRPSGNKGKVVCYEELVADTPRLLEEISRFVGMPYEPSMLRHWEREHHFIGGNVGTLSAVARMHDKEVCAEEYRKAHSWPEQNWDLRHYERTSPANFVDQRWKQELTDVQLRVFGLIAGGVNRRLGYSRSLDRTSVRRAG
jgi:hypothetical protein